MDLSQSVVDEYIAAAKVISRPRRIGWRREGLDFIRWDAPVEVDGVARGRLWLRFNMAKGDYSFNLQLAGTSVYGWHFRPWGGRHRNCNCGADFPASARYPHEQFWIEGRGFHCARTLEGVGGMSHEEHLRAFCVRANIEFHPTYTQPVQGEQGVLPLHFEDDDE
jgi:hypothetical protein